MKSNLKNSEKLLNVIGEVKDDLIPDQTAKAPNRALKITLSAMCGLCAAFAIVGVGMKVYSRIQSERPGQIGTSIPVATDSGTQTAETTVSASETEQTATQTAPAKSSPLWKDLTPASCKPEKNGTESITLPLNGFNNTVGTLKDQYYYSTENGWLVLIDTFFDSAGDQPQQGRGKLPVFKNTGRGTGMHGESTSILLSEEQTGALVKRASELLNLPDVSVDVRYGDAEETMLKSCSMTSDEAEVTAECNGTVTVLMSETVPDSVLADDDALIRYFTEKYAPLTGWAQTEGYVRTVVTDSVNRVVCLYEHSDDKMQELLNDSLSTIEITLVTSDHETEQPVTVAGSVVFRNALLNAGYIGDYERISIEDAVTKLTEIDLKTIGAQDYPPIADYLAGGRIPRERIAGSELVYIYLPYEDYIAPYYRIWVDSTDLLADDEYLKKTQPDNPDIRYYTPFDVPAVRTAD